MHRGGLCTALRVTFSIAFGIAFSHHEPRASPRPPSATTPRCPLPMQCSAVQVQQRHCNAALQGSGLCVACWFYFFLLHIFFFLFSVHSKESCRGGDGSSLTPLPLCLLCIPFTPISPRPWPKIRWGFNTSSTTGLSPSPCKPPWIPLGFLHADTGEVLHPAAFWAQEILPVIPSSLPFPYTASTRRASTSKKGDQSFPSATAPRHSSTTVPTALGMEGKGWGYMDRKRDGAAAIPITASQGKAGCMGKKWGLPGTTRTRTIQRCGDMRKGRKQQLIMINEAEAAIRGGKHGRPAAGAAIRCAQVHAVAVPCPRVTQRWAPTTQHIPQRETEANNEDCHGGENSMSCRGLCWGCQHRSQPRCGTIPRRERLCWKCCFEQGPCSSTTASVLLKAEPGDAEQLNTVLKVAFIHHLATRLMAQDVPQPECAAPSAQRCCSSHQCSTHSWNS